MSVITRNGNSYPTGLTVKSYFHSFLKSPNRTIYFLKTKVKKTKTTPPLVVAYHIKGGPYVWRQSHACAVAAWLLSGLSFRQHARKRQQHVAGVYRKVELQSQREGRREVL